jgi:hypothetical protein
LFEGDPAPADSFQELVSIKSSNAIGSTGAERLVPWLGKGGPRDYLIILSDPRLKSQELSTTVRNLRADLPDDIWSKLIVVNADSPVENRRWLKKIDLVDNLNLYSDEKMEWMRSYTALGEKRWSMTMFVIANERIQKMARELDSYDASRTISNAVKAFKEARL